MARILVVDDEPDTLRTLEFILSSAGHAVVTASQGAEALAQLCAGRGCGSFELLVFDIEMPGLNGDELIRLLREREINLPALALTGYGSKEVLTRLLRAGCSEYLDKPVNPEELLRRTTALLNKSERGTQQMLTSRRVIHDVNNMLCAAKGYAEMAMELYESGDDIKRPLNGICKATSHAGSLTRQYMRHVADCGIARDDIETMTAFDITRMVHSTTELLRAVVGKGIQTEFHLPKTPVRVYGDEIGIEQALINLVVNARDAMPGGGVLNIAIKYVARESGTRRHDGRNGAKRYVCLTVSDTGIGMDSRTLSRAFDSHFSTKQKSKGTGLGLSTVQAVVERHEGFIEVDSEPGRGTCFRILLPAAGSDSQTAWRTVYRNRNNRTASGGRRGLNRNKKR